jgi:hypothetical protein
VSGFRLRRRVRVLLRDLDVRPPLTVPDLCARLAEYRGRPICLLPYPIPVPGPSGACLSTDRAGYIGFQAATSRAHQDHIVLHLVSHLIAGHHGDPPDGQALLLLPGLQDKDVRGTFLCGPGRPGPCEAEAEEIATLIPQWAAALDQYAGRMPSTRAGTRLAQGLTDHLGWL